MVSLDEQYNELKHRLRELEDRRHELSRQIYAVEDELRPVKRAIQERELNGVGLSHSNTYQLDAAWIDWYENLGRGNAGVASVYEDISTITVHYLEEGKVRCSTRDQNGNGGWSIIALPEHLHAIVGVE